MKRLYQNKKAFAYLISASILSLVIIFVFLMASKYSFQDKQEVQQNRIKLMDDFISDFNQDIHRATFIASFRTLLALEDYIAVEGEFFNNTEDIFKETFFNGTIAHEPAPLLNESSFSDYLLKVNALAQQIGLESSINVTKITLFHADPWHISVIVHAQVYVADSRNIAAWHFEKNYTTLIPIYDLRDPLYSTFTDNLVPNTVRRFDAPFLVNVSTNDTTYLQAHIDNSYYLASPLAPSFLQRFENNITPHPYGIESIVNVADISLQTDGDFVYENRIKVDFIYFNDLSYPKICSVDGITPSSYFVISENRKDLYEVGGLSYQNTTCP